ncbi:ATP-binding cassette (ABC) Superfamily [Phytophthora palmivora]|uniref:ATP-binding cassette (ABC) Superfamily n=1 Tax=Phytophthora palmivora TaxID=4796 RepID=A0A2P4YKN2_9STRA|nr:ATP-binding cassette (ABC) Superfamily [Phytophthora palmivora]
MSSKNAIKLLNIKVRHSNILYAFNAGKSSRIPIHRMRGLGIQCSWSISVILVVLNMGELLAAPVNVPWRRTNNSFLRKKPEDRGGLIPVWRCPWVSPRPSLRQKTWSGDGRIKGPHCSGVKGTPRLSFSVLSLEPARVFPLNYYGHPVTEGLDNNLSPALMTSAGTVPLILGPFM